ncbi:MAG: alpha-amylase family glycosyl hydrolase [Candidatus Limnocylindrales bacterium]
MLAAGRLRPLLLAALLAAGCGTPAVPSTAGGSAPPPSSATAPAPSRASSPSPSATAGSACAPATTPPTYDWNNRVWYEAFVRSFADGNGDGIGDFRGLTAKLDYLNDGNPATTSDLGVTGIWLMPIFEAASYHGYDVIDYRKVERDYGSSADFAAFLAAAHRRGIKVILDLTLNHTSDQNPWFTASSTGTGPYADWYVWSANDPLYAGPQGQTVWHPLGGRYYYGVFGASMPDLNLRNPAVTAEMDGIAKFWLDLGVDGFRLDAAPYLIEDGQKQFSTPETLAWLRNFQTGVKADAPGAMTVGEVWASSSIAGKYVPASADLTFNFDLASATVASIQTGQPSALASALGETVTAWPANQEGTFLTNHDQERVMTTLGGRMDEARLAALLLLTEPGVPFIYYGEELGLTGSKPDEQIRTPMPWTADPKRGGFTTGTPWEPLAEGTATTNVRTETADPSSLLSTYRSLIRLHDAQAPLHEGSTVPVTATGPVVAWLRVTAQDAQLVLANTSNAPSSDYALSLDAGPLCSPGGAATVLAAVGAATTIQATPPARTSAGGFAGYRPVATLPAHAGVVIDFGRP